MKTVLYASRLLAESLTGDVTSLMISITNPAQPLATLRSNWGAIHRLQFHDVDSYDYLGHKVFNNTDAEGICQFLQAHANTTSGIVVHCHSGVSRSTAIAKALAEHYRLALYPEEPKYYNPLVYKIMRKALSTFCIKPA